LRFRADVRACGNEALNRADANPETRALLEEILGEEGDAGTGVRWRHEGESVLPELSDTFAQGALAAMRDVRDEAMRRMRTSTQDEGQS